MSCLGDAQVALKATSRTFYEPIMGLPPRLHEAVASAYLCLRAVDDIEDEISLPADRRALLLRDVSLLLQASAPVTAYKRLLHQGFGLPAVSLALPDWLCLAPRDIAPRIGDATAVLADRMAGSLLSKSKMRTRADLDRYTYNVAGVVGLLLCDLWAWYDGTPTDRSDAIGFGRGLQAANILLDRSADLADGVDFYPDGWADEDMLHYAIENLRLAEAYQQALPAGPARDFCAVPLALAWAGLEARGETAVARICSATGE
jgi:farnesyl-diphosphate farnesyltransferase